tara:strand:+ start:145 stop:390 length:246 start_codon:yes stop_codon:yes gene_type:complete
MEIKLIPKAVLRAFLNLKFCFNKITVSRVKLVINPLIIAKIIIPRIGKLIPVVWKNRIVPKSPIEQPNKHHKVFLELLFQV